MSRSHPPLLSLSLSLSLLSTHSARADYSPCLARTRLDKWRSRCPYPRRELHVRHAGPLRTSVQGGKGEFSTLAKHQLSFETKIVLVLRERKLLHDYPAREDMLLHDYPAREDMLLHDYPAREDMLLHDYTAREDMLLTTQQERTCSSSMVVVKRRWSA